MKHLLPERGFTFLLLALLPAVVIGCNSTGPAILATDSPQLQFGDVAPGQSEAATLTLRNDGEGGIVLDAAAISGEQASSFLVSTGLAGTSLDGGASIEVQIQFAPAAVGAHTALLTISGSQSVLSGGGGSGAPAVLPVAITLLGSSSPGDDDDSGSGDDDDDSGSGDDDDDDDDDIGDDDTKTPSTDSSEGTRQPRLSSGGGNADTSQVRLKNSSIQSGGGTSSSPNYRLEGSM